MAVYPTPHVAYGHQLRIEHVARLPRQVLKFAAIDCSVVLEHSGAEGDLRARGVSSVTLYLRPKCHAGQR